jgi:ubiquinone/menaquinone biosynthesis C-methylase UbiE
MEQIKTFGKIDSLDEQNRVNDAQKAVFDAMVTASGGALSEQRRTAYLQRWSEALVHIGQGARVLDIGGGWPVERVWDRIIRDHGIDYHLLDIDAGIIADAQTRLPRYGLPPNQATTGMNTVVPYADATFDVVFSSHCLEHSSDLPQTFAEIHRALKPGGTLIYAVPFGFDDSDEHMICLDADEWIAATELAGFDVVTYHLDATYVMAGWDLMVVARRSGDRRDLAALQTLVSRFTKAGRSILPPGSSSFAYVGPVVESGADRILNGLGASAIVTSPDLIDAVLFLRHPWSGVVELRSGHRTQIRELHSRISHIQLIPLDEPSRQVEITVVGSSRGLDQAVLHGVMLAPPAVP